jgi:hypothetical protein
MQTIEIKQQELDKPTKCPYCNETTDMAAAMHNHKPTPGSISVCLHCMHWAIFDKDLSLRKPTTEETMRLGNDPRFIIAQQLGALLGQGFQKTKSSVN